MSAARFASSTLLALAMAGGFAPPAAAQRAQMPSVEDIVRKLVKPRIGDEVLRDNAVQVEGRRQRTDTGPPGSIDLAVNFEYDSAKLTPDARILLDNLGRALADPALRDSRFRIAGHTDARGGDAYNLALSKRRARSVADYLKRQHGIAPARLGIEGFGRGQLLDPANPDSAVNRRVQITNLGS